MDINLRPFTMDQARQVASWTYPAPYQAYNISWQEVINQGYGMGQAPIQAREFVSLYLGDAFIGYGRIKRQKNQAVIGIGLAPDYCGRGLGGPAFKVLIAEALLRHPVKVLKLLVRTFNQRAIRTYENLGFKVIGTSKQETGTFYEMTYDKEAKWEKNFN